MAKTQTDVFIAGGGIAGLTAALAFAHGGYDVVLASPDRPVTEANADRSDLRSTAFLQPGRALFDRIGLWRHLAGDAVPLETLRIVDSTGTPPAPRDTRAFQSSDLGLESFGWNLINWRTTAALMAALAETPRVDLRFGTRFESLLPRDREAIVRLDTGDRIAARLVVAADGRASAVRQAVGIGVDTVRTGQKALAMMVTHPAPHGNCSTEIYHEGGPFTMVPMPQTAGGENASAVVWMNPAAEAERLAALPTEALSETMTARSCAWLGPLTLASPVRIWPIISQRARALTAPRTAVIAEAAHVMPPIGAQGLNTSLHDLRALLEAAESAEIGSPAMLAHYAKARGTDIAARVAAIDLFNRVTRSPNPMVQSLRLAGLRAVYDIAPLRKGVMRAGLGQ